MATTRRESWADVVSALARVQLALDGPGFGQRESWDLEVSLGWFQGPAVWHASLGTSADEDAVGDVPILRFRGEATDRGPRVVLDVGEETFAFPPEAEEVDEGMAWRMGARALEAWREARRTLRPARLPVDPFLERDFVTAMDDTWERVTPALRDVVEGTRAVRILIDETGGVVRWGYVVGVLDPLLAKGVDMFAFDPPGRVLRFEVPPEPAPRRPWQRPIMSPPVAPGLALAFGVLLAAFAFRGPRRRPWRTKAAEEG